MICAQQISEQAARCAQHVDGSMHFFQSGHNTLEMRKIGNMLPRILAVEVSGLMNLSLIDGISSYYNTRSDAGFVWARIHFSNEIRQMK